MYAKFVAYIEPVAWCSQPVYTGAVIANRPIILSFESPSKRPLASPLRLNTCEKALESAFDQVAAAHRLRSGRSVHRTLLRFS